MVLILYVPGHCLFLLLIEAKHHNVIPLNVKTKCFFFFLLLKAKSAINHTFYKKVHVLLFRIFRKYQAPLFKTFMAMFIHLTMSLLNRKDSVNYFIL